MLRNEFAIGDLVLIFTRLQRASKSHFGAGLRGGISDSLEGGEMNLLTASLPNDVWDRRRGESRHQEGFRFGRRRIQ